MSAQKRRRQAIKRRIWVRQLRHKWNVKMGRVIAGDSDAVE